MNPDRAMIIAAVLEGQLPASVLTDEDITHCELRTMNMIIETKMANGLIVFADHSTVQ